MMVINHYIDFKNPTVSAVEYVRPDLTPVKSDIRDADEAEPCLYHWLITDDCIERKVADAVRSGMEISRDILDKWESEGVSAYQSQRFQPFKKTELLPHVDVNTGQISINICCDFQK